MTATFFLIALIAWVAVLVQRKHFSRVVADLLDRLQAIDAERRKADAQRDEERGEQDRNNDLMLKAIFQSVVPLHIQAFLLAKPTTLNSWKKLDAEVREYTEDFERDFARAAAGDSNPDLRLLAPGTRDCVLVSSIGEVMQFRFIRIGEFSEVHPSNRNIDDFTGYSGSPLRPSFEDFVANESDSGTYVDSDGLETRHRGTEIRGFGRWLDPDDGYAVMRARDGGWFPLSLTAAEGGTMENLSFSKEMRSVGYLRRDNQPELDRVGMSNIGRWFFPRTLHDNDPSEKDWEAHPEDRLAKNKEVDSEDYLTYLDLRGRLFDYEAEKATWWEERGFTAKAPWYRELLKKRKEASTKHLRTDESDEAEE